MITPRFSCTQTDQSVIVSVYCPSVRASDAEIHVDGPLFSLHINPYFLRLHFSHNVLDDEASSAEYDPSSGYLTVTITKEVKGQEFKDLDLLATLLAPRPSIKPHAIEVLSSDSAGAIVQSEEGLSPEQKEILTAAHNDWQLPQVPDTSNMDLSSQKYYGFLNLHNGYFRHVTHTENEVNELGGEAEVCHVDDRRKRRIEHEDQKFDPEYYMADYADDGMIQELLRWEHPYVVADHEHVEFTDEEKMAMLKLPRKEYLATPQQTHGLYLTLVTLLFSYAYESRTTQQDPTPESAWTICTLTPAFSALDPPTCSNADAEATRYEIHEVLVPSYRRSLTFPLYRSFALAEACQRDVSVLLSRGKRLVFRCLLEMKSVLDHHEVYYIYSKIWLDDFCTWIQAYTSDTILANLAKVIEETRIKKSDMGWDLEGLENAIHPLEREPDSDDEDLE
ncbi:hypothetical protein APHAL10511_007044 [Amanita phalloides]|nr:hypothetical protein APHAL10511_007044 [Amanita phalloides]